MEQPRSARGVAFRVAGTAAALSIAKIAIGIMSGSLSVLSSALDSVGDTLASFVNFLFIRIAEKPPDEDHPFGHGKAEHLASLFQGVLLLSGAAFLAVKAVERLHDPQPVDASVVAIATMLLSTVASVAIAGYLQRSAASQDSSALAADGLHYSSDVAANIATAVGLILVKLTGRPAYDSVIAIPIAVWIGWNAAKVIWDAVSDLMDRALPAREVDTIIHTIEKSHSSVLGYHHLRTRRAGGLRFIEFELWIDRDVSFDVAHDITEMVKGRIEEAFPRSIITIHSEPMNRTRGCELGEF